VPTARRDANQSRRGRADAQALDDFKLLFLICLPMAHSWRRRHAASRRDGTGMHALPRRDRQRGGRHPSMRSGDAVHRFQVMEMQTT
jgi:hypothetical protein